MDQTNSDKEENDSHKNNNDNELAAEAAAKRLPKVNVVLKRCDEKVNSKPEVEPKVESVEPEPAEPVPVLRIVRKSPPGAAEATFAVTTASAVSPKAAGGEGLTAFPAALPCPSPEPKGGRSPRLSSLRV